MSGHQGSRSGCRELGYRASLVAGLADQIRADVEDRSSDANRDRGALRRLHEDTIAEHGGGLKDWTVLAPQNDPFWVDTPSGHRDGKWLAMHAAHKLGDRVIHLRGFHYAVLERAQAWWQAVIRFGLVAGRLVPTPDQPRIPIMSTGECRCGEDTDGLLLCTGCCRDRHGFDLEAEAVEWVRLGYLDGAIADVLDPADAWEGA